MEMNADVENGWRGHIRVYIVWNGHWEYVFVWNKVAPQVPRILVWMNEQTWRRGVAEKQMWLQIQHQMKRWRVHAIPKSDSHICFWFERESYKREVISKPSAGMLCYSQYSTISYRAMIWRRSVLITDVTAWLISTHLICHRTKLYKFHVPFTSIVRNDWCIFRCIKVESGYSTIACVKRHY